MMIADLRALADLWNRQYQPSADRDALLAQAPSPGVTRYCKIHEDSLAGATPYAQVAIEYEIEMLPLRFGEAFLTRCADVLGPDILSCLSFVTSHIQLDVAHTKTNAWAMAEVFREVPGSTPVLAARRSRPSPCRTAAWWRRDTSGRRRGAYHGPLMAPEMP
jgi:hypothetical protein